MEQSANVLLDPAVEVVLAATRPLVVALQHFPSAGIQQRLLKTEVGDSAEQSDGLVVTAAHEGGESRIVESAGQQGLILLPFQEVGEDLIDLKLPPLDLVERRGRSKSV